MSEVQDLLDALNTDEGRRDPFPIYRRLHRISPIHRDPASGLWLLLGWEDCNRVFRSDRFGQGVPGGRLRLDPRFETSATLQTMGQNLTGLDPPDHTRVRAIVQRAFILPAVEKMRGYVEALTASLLDELEGRSSFDVIADYAARIPNTVICEMLGIPREDHVLFDKWLSDQFRLVRPTPASDELLADTDRSTEALEAYLNQIISERRQSPREDLISALIAAEDDGSRLSPRETVVMISLLLAGGSESTKTTIAFAVGNLLRHPAELARLRADPSLDRPAMEELLRYEGPIHMANVRMSFDEAELSGVTIRAGESVVPVVLSANRDPAKFSNPEGLDIGRNPNPHLSFAVGVHMCLGIALARLEAVGAIGALVRRFPELELSEARPDINLNLASIRGLNTLHVRKA